MLRNVNQVEPLLVHDVVKCIEFECYYLHRGGILWHYPERRFPMLLSLPKFHVIPIGCMIQVQTLRPAN